MPKIIGLTGGIGSGKTTVAKIFMEQGIAVYNTDHEAKRIMQTPEIVSQIESVFGLTVFENNLLNRQMLADIVFKHPQKLALLNSIVHPAVKKDFESWLNTRKLESMVVYESAILFENGSYTLCDKIITVTAPIETRIQRVLLRDKCSRDQVLQRINTQWNDSKRIEKSDFVIENSFLEKTRVETLNILKVLRNFQ